MNPRRAIRNWLARLGLLLALALLISSGTGCGRNGASPANPPPDAPVRTRGHFEVTARLVEIPDGAIFQRELYDYATILKYEVITVHRGDVRPGLLYVGHYNPFKPRREAADRRVKEIGGALRRFRAGDVHRLALERPLDDHFMGGLVNKYFGQETGPLYWAVWTDPAAE